MIRLGCCSFVFGRLGLEESLRLCRTLGFGSVDVSAADVGPNAHVDQQAAAAHPRETAGPLREMASRNGLALEELFLCPVFVDGKRVEVSHPDAGLRRRLLEQFGGIAAFARAAGFRSIMGVPGTPQEDLGREGAWAHATETLRAMVAIAEAAGVALNVEPHTGSLIEEPEAALRMADEVPGLGFTLDYAHFAQRGIPQERVYPLHARTRHMHARQARPGRGGCAVEDGTIDFGAIVERLAASEWDGVIAMEFFGGVGPKPWAEHAVVQNVVLAHRLWRLASFGKPREAARQGESRQATRQGEEPR
jgi:sugar phosphate isomerase/epimerase